MTQHQLIIQYIKEHGSILPAKMAGVIYKGQMFGSETSKRCRELRSHEISSIQKYPEIISHGDGKFERFLLLRKEDYINYPDEDYKRPKEDIEGTLPRNYNDQVPRTLSEMRGYPKFAS